MIRAVPPTEQESFREARAEAWRYAFICLSENRREKQEATRPGGPDDAKEGSENDSHAKPSLPK